MSAISKVMSEVAQGNFSDRVTINMNGVFNELKNTMTSSLDALQGAITSLNDVASAQNNGELHKRMEGNHHGELANIQEAVNASMHNLSGIVKNVQDSSRKAADVSCTNRDRLHSNIRAHHSSARGKLSLTRNRR